MDTIALASSIRDHCRTTFESFLQSHGSDNIIGFALYTSEDFLSLSAIGATKEGQLANALCSPEEFLFECDEWDLMPQRSVSANQIIEKWYREGEAQESENENWFNKYQTAISTAAVNALSDLVDDGLFGPDSVREHLFLILGVSDSMMPYVEGIQWSERLNTPSMHARYRAFAKRVVEQGYF